MSFNFVRCEVKQCRYHSPSNFCLRPITYINKAGYCGYVYNANGNLSPFFNSGDGNYNRLNFTRANL